MTARLASRLLAFAVGSDLADDVAGDLEEIRQSRAVRSRIAAAAWFWIAIAGIVTTAVRRRSRDVVRSLAQGGFGFGRVPSEIRGAFRTLRRTPWFATTAISVIALAMTLATTVFAMVDGVLFKPLPYRGPSDLYDVSGSFRALSSDAFRISASRADVRAWSSAAPEVPITSFAIGMNAIVGENDGVRSAQVDAHFFDTLGVRPLLGGFLPEDFAASAPIKPALVSYAFWQQRLGGDQAAINRVLSANGAGIRVRGVLSRDFVFPQPFGRFVPDVLTALGPLKSDDNPRARSLYVIARVPAGALASVQARFTAATAEVARQFPPLPDDPSMSPTRRITRGPFDLVKLQPLRSVMTTATSTVSMLIFAAAAALVLLACLNLACLSAGRLIDRRRELALRRALGSSGWALVRLLAIEHAVVIVLGAAVGLVAARWLIHAALALTGSDIFLIKPPAVDLRVAGAAALAAMIAIVIVTAWSAVTVLRTAPRPALADASGASGRAGARARMLLVGGQIAIALVMLLGGALLVVSLARVWSEDPGYRVDHTAVIGVSPPRSLDLDTTLAAIAMLRHVPGISAAAGICHPFLDRAIAGSEFSPPSGIVRTTDVEEISVTSEYFGAAGLRAIDGRLPAPGEFDAGQHRVVISQRVASLYFPGRSPIGQTLAGDKDVPFTVIGVVPDARYASLDRDSDGEIYAPIAADQVITTVLVTFDAGADDRLADVLRDLQARAPGLRILHAETMAEALGASIQARRFQTSLFATFGGAALLIVGVGILGTIAMAVSRRTKEVGIRMALGARWSTVVSMILLEQVSTVVAGLAAGALAAAWASGFLKTYLYKITVYDWRAWILATVGLILVSAIAAIVPALRASRTDPVKALRVE